MSRGEDEGRVRTAEERGATTQTGLNWTRMSRGDDEGRTRDAEEKGATTQTGLNWTAMSRGEDEGRVRDAEEKGATTQTGLNWSAMSRGEDEGRVRTAEEKGATTQTGLNWTRMSRGEDEGRVTAETFSNQNGDTLGKRALSLTTLTSLSQIFHSLRLALLWVHLSNRSLNPYHPHFSAHTYTFTNDSHTYTFTYLPTLKTPPSPGSPLPHISQPLYAYFHHFFTTATFIRYQTE